jgi:hypothetical protein
MFFLSPWICSSSCADMVFIVPLWKGPDLPQVCSSSFSICYLPVLIAGLHLSLDKDFIFTQIFSSIFQRYGHHISFDIIFIFPQLRCLHFLRYDLLPQIWCSQFLWSCLHISLNDLHLLQLYISTFLRCSFQISLGIVITIAKVSSAYFCVYTEIFTCIRSLSILRNILHCS